MLTVEIITPDKIILKEEADEIVVPTVNGEIAILPHHTTLISQLSQGEVTIKKSAKSSHVAVTGGYIEVNNNNVSILADYAVRSEEIEIAKAEEAKKAAEKLMEEKLSKKDFAEAEAQLRRSLLELKVARRRKQRITQPGS